MYKSPITIIQDQIQMKIENDILKAIQRQNIVVDKEELIKALGYDREQYEKGYEDAKWEFADKMDRIVEELERAEGTVCGHKDIKNNCGGCAGCIECKMEDAYRYAIEIVKNGGKDE